MMLEKKGERSRLTKEMIDDERGNCKTRGTMKTGDETETNIRLRSKRGNKMGGIGRQLIAVQRC